MIHKYYLVKKSFKIPATLYQPIDDMCPGHGEFSINESVSYKKGDLIATTEDDVPVCMAEGSFFITPCLKIR